VRTRPLPVRVRALRTLASGGGGGEAHDAARGARQIRKPGAGVLIASTQIADREYADREYANRGYANRKSEDRKSEDREYADSERHHLEQRIEPSLRGGGRRASERGVTPRPCSASLTRPTAAACLATSSARSPSTCVAACGILAHGFARV